MKKGPDVSAENGNKLSANSETEETKQKSYQNKISNREIKSQYETTKKEKENINSLPARTCFCRINDLKAPSE